MLNNDTVLSMFDHLIFVASSEQGHHHFFYQRKIHFKKSSEKSVFQSYGPDLIERMIIPPTVCQIIISNFNIELNY